jgi:hypothetical protein
VIEGSQIRRDQVAWEKSPVGHPLQGGLEISREKNVETIRSCVMWPQRDGAIERPSRYRGDQEG